MVYNNRDVITSSGNYTAPVTGWYKVTVKGGGGGGMGYSNIDTPILWLGIGGGEGGTYIGYHKLTKNDVIPCVIGAGGIGGQSGTTSGSQRYGGSGGYSTVIINGTSYNASGSGSNCEGGTGVINGASGGGLFSISSSGMILSERDNSAAGAGGGGGHITHLDALPNSGSGGGGGWHVGETYYNAGNGGSGYIWFEYFDPDL